MNGLSIRKGIETETDNVIVISLWNIAAELARHRGITIVLPILVAIISGATALTSPRQYTGNAAFIPVGSQRPVSQAGQVASQLGLAIGGGGDQGALYLELLRLRDVLILTLHQAAFPEIPSRSKTVAQAWFQDGTAGDHVKTLRSRIKVALEGATGIIRVQVTMPDSVAAESITRALLRSVDEFNSERRRSQAVNEREFVQLQTGLARDSLHNAEGNLTDFLLHNRRYAEAPELNAREVSLEREATMRQQIYSSLAHQLISMRIEEVRATPVISILETPDGNVRARSRGTLVRALLGWFVATVFALVFVLGRRAIRLQNGRPDFEEFRATWRRVR